MMERKLFLWTLVTVLGIGAAYVTPSYAVDSEPADTKSSADAKNSNSKVNEVEMSKSVREKMPTEDFINTPYIVDVPVESRSISFESPTGAKGQGGKAAHKNLGVGRKGRPCKIIPAGETITLCDIKGPGVIRHIWMTCYHPPANLRSLVIRGYWEGQKHPSIEAPIGSFFGVSHGHVGAAYSSAVHTVNPKAGFNLFLAMPFSKRAKFTITNESKARPLFFYNIDYTIGDKLPKKFGRLHTLFRRENPTTLKEDFEILPKRTGCGRFLGCVIGVRPLRGSWWGEGEIKMYLDGDKKFPTIVGTGTEDYIGQSWGLQLSTHPYGGTNLNEKRKGLFSFYRWHIKDPIYWKKDIRVTMQQIGINKKGLFERQDDWSSCAFWYEPTPSKPLPPMPDAEARNAGYTELDKKPVKKSKKTPAKKPVKKPAKR